MGTTMNHVAAVSVPITGALLWQATGNYQLPFTIGIAVAIVSLIVTLRLPRGAAARQEPATVR
jgi:cyanate permease